MGAAMGDPQGTVISNIMDKLGLGAPAQLDPNDPKVKIMRDILSTKTMYDAEFDRLQAYFGPHMQHLDGDKHRTVLFIDPLKLQSAQAYGIKPTEFLSFALAEKGLKTHPLALYNIFNAASSVTGTAPCAVPVYDALKQNMADVVVPKSHMRQLKLDIPGLKPSEITTLVNYHEFFHCLHDKYAEAKPFENTSQKREMFADVGAMLEMMRRGSGPEIIDQMIIWRMRGKDDAHATVPALLALKNHVSTHGGVEGVRAMKTKDVLDLCYKATEEGSGMSAVSRVINFARSAPDLKAAAEKSQKPGFKFQDLMPDFTLAKTLEDRAVAIAGKVTPKSLMQANNALQQEYAAQHEKNPDDMKPMFTAAQMQITYNARVQATDYTAANARRGATLTADDQREIDFVKKTPPKVGTAPVPRR